MIQALVSAGVPPQLASLAVAITDTRHKQYDQITSALLSSNPRGFAKWFQTRARPFAETRLQQLVERGLYASVDDVPPYEWKTPLQRSIQILKRHRDVMFQNSPKLAPISMIITNLAAQAYAGEGDVASALNNIVDAMPTFVRQTKPRVPNPADPAEDYADGWSRDPSLERNFWLWHAQLQRDVRELATGLPADGVEAYAQRAFRVNLTSEEIIRYRPEARSPAAAVVASAPAVHIANAPRPWRGGA